MSLVNFSEALEVLYRSEPMTVGIYHESFLSSMMICRQESGHLVSCNKEDLGKSECRQYPFKWTISYIFEQKIFEDWIIVRSITN